MGGFFWLHLSPFSTDNVKRVGIIRNMNTKSEFVEQMARVSERNLRAP